MTGHILIVFGGGVDDGWMAGDFAGLYKFFESDPQNSMTAYTHIDLEGFVKENGPLLFGDNRLSLGRLAVFGPGDAPFWHLIIEGQMKAAVSGWCAQTAAACVPGDKVTVIFVCHGGGSVIEFRLAHHLMEYFDVSEMKTQVDVFPPFVHINIINAACHAGSWIAPLCQPVVPNTPQSISVHAACDVHDKAYALRSTSGKYRCGVFPAAVVDSLKENTSMYLHGRSVRQTTHLYDCRMNTQLGVDPQSVLNKTSSENYTASAFGFLQTGIKGWISSLMSTISSTFFPHPSARTRLAPGRPIVEKAVVQQSSLSADETGTYFLAQRYLNGKISALETRVLEDIMNKRRQCQLMIFFFIKEGIARKIFSTKFVRQQIKWSEMTRKAASNLRTLSKIFPMLNETFWIETSPQYVRGKFEAPLDYLAILITNSLAIPEEESAEKIKQIGLSVGWGADEDADVQGLKFLYSEPPDVVWITEGNSQLFSLDIFDRLLPTSIKEWEFLSANWMDLQNSLLL